MLTRLSQWKSWRMFLENRWKHLVTVNFFSLYFGYQFTPFQSAFLHFASCLLTFLYVPSRYFFIMNQTLTKYTKKCTKTQWISPICLKIHVVLRDMTFWHKVWNVRNMLFFEFFLIKYYQFNPIYYPSNIFFMLKHVMRKIL